MIFEDVIIFDIFRLLLGSVNHALKFEKTETIACQPIPLEASCHIADHIQVSAFIAEKRLYKHILIEVCCSRNRTRHIHFLYFSTQVILAGFAEQSKTSVVHMCSLFHAFILCQLWTVYLEQTIAMASPRDESIVLASSILLDFWGKVTPGNQTIAI